MLTVFLSFIVLFCEDSSMRVEDLAKGTGFHN